jgi:hypothetical protein
MTKGVCGGVFPPETCGVPFIAKDSCGAVRLLREADEADNLFGRLMGDEVEPRREFIQDNALSVAESGRVGPPS